MSFKSLTQPLRDILDGVNMIEEFTAGMDFEAFRTNPMAVAAVERKLLTIGEAAVRLGREAPSIVPDIPSRCCAASAYYAAAQQARKSYSETIGLALTPAV